MGRYDNRKYVIIPLSKVEDINYDEIVEKNAQALRISQDGEYTMVKFDSDITPSFLDGFTQYSHTEIIHYYIKHKRCICSLIFLPISRLSLSTTGVKIVIWCRCLCALYIQLLNLNFS